MQARLGVAFLDLAAASALSGRQPVAAESHEPGVGSGIRRRGQDGDDRLGQRPVRARTATSVTIKLTARARCDGFRGHPLAVAAY